MKTLKSTLSWLRLCLATLAVCGFAAPLGAQTLINIEFGAGGHGLKTGFAATGQTTNDVWNLFSLYQPKFTPGMALVYNGKVPGLKLADGTATDVGIEVTNAPGVWGNSTGDPMYDSYVFAPDGSNIVVTLTRLEPGRYNIYLYGHAEADASGEQTSVFKIHSGGTNYGPLTTLSTGAWKASMPWQENQQYVVLRDVVVKAGEPVTIDVMPGPNGIAVLNGMQISSKGTSPPRLVETATAKAAAAFTNLVIREIRYDGKVSDTEAKFSASVQLESFTTNEISAPLFQGDVAVTAKELPAGVRLTRAGNQYFVWVSAPSNYDLKLDVFAKITKAEPWNQIRFEGPSAAIASIRAQASGEGVEMQLLSGTALDSNATSHVEGFLSAGREVSLRWQSKAAEVARNALITVETTSGALVTPAVIKVATTMHYELLQASVPRLRIALPAGQSLTKLEGEQIRNWEVAQDGARSVLTIEFIKPVEKKYQLALFTEQAIGAMPSTIEITAPQPLDIERESGSFSVTASDTVVDITGEAGLRRVNAVGEALAAFQFSARPFLLTANAKRIEPVRTVEDRVSARLEESRLVVTHSVSLKVEKAGIYMIEFTPPTNFVVASVRSGGMEDDWKLSEGKVRVNFAGRVLGTANLEVQLEQALKTFPEQITIAPLRVTDAEHETATIGVAAAPGLRVRTSEMTGARDIPVTQLVSRAGDEVLAYTASQPDWKLTLSTERLPARIGADIFNLITIGDGVVGGSATVRYDLVNQGVQEFHLTVPAHWKNVEFTGMNIRNRDQQSNAWTIHLQEKAWNGYTLVVTYDYQFDASNAVIDAAGLHSPEAEHETGSVAITTAASVNVTNETVVEPLRVIDQTELAESDRALVTRSILKAFHYTGHDYQLKLHVTRQPEEAVLDAVADREQLTSALTDSGEMLTQASFMVKNNGRLFQRFQLPEGAKFWGCYVDGQTSKAEQDKNWYLVPLPQRANRDEAFAVDIVYAQGIGDVKGPWIPRRVALEAPQTDFKNTFAEWEVYRPADSHFSSFGGSMTVARGTTYGVHDAWVRFCEVYADFFSEYGTTVSAIAVVALLVVLVAARIRVGNWRAVIIVLSGVVVIGILLAMSIPDFVRARTSGVTQYLGGIAGNATDAVQEDQSAASPGANHYQHSDELVARLAERRAAEEGQPMAQNGAAQSTRGGGGGGRAGRGAGVGGAGGGGFGGGGFAGGAGGGFGGGANQPGAVGQMPSAEAAASQPAAAPATTQLNAAPSDLNAQRELPGGPAVAAAAVPTAAGLRSIHIDIPKNGQPYTFTKVLNTSDKPLDIRMSVMNAEVFAVARSGSQVAVFLLGLLLIWGQRRKRGSFMIAVGTALAACAVAELLITGRVLHWAFIGAVPVLALVVLVALLRKLWPKKAASENQRSEIRDQRSERTNEPEPPTPPAVPPVVASIALLLFLTHSAAAQDPADWMAFGDAYALPTNAEAALGASGLRASVLRPLILNPKSSITSASYTGVITEKVAQFEGSVVLTSVSTNQTLPLFGNDVALEDFTVKSGEARLLRNGDRVGVFLPNPGEAVVTLKFVVKLGGDVSKRRLSFAIPPALSTAFSASIDEADADVEFPSAVAFQRTQTNMPTRITATIGPEDRVEIVWTPRTKKANEVAATISVENDSLVTLSNGVMDVRSELNYQISQGELREATVSLPQGQRLLRVEGDSIRTWRVSPPKDNAPGGGEILTVELIKGVSPSYKLTVETEKIMDAFPVTVALAIPHALDVKRETGLVAARGGEELSLTVDHETGANRVDAAGFPHSDGTGTLFRVWQFLTPGFDLALKAEAVKPEVEAVVHNSVKISPAQVTLSATINYTIKRAGKFAFQVALPAGYTLDNALGDNILQWHPRDAVAGAGQILDVTFKNRVMGAYSLHLELHRLHEALPPTVSIPGVQPLEVQKLSGYVTVAADPGVSARTTNFDGLTEIPGASLTTGAAGTAALAYKFLSAQPGPLPEWKLDVACEKIDPWVRAQIAQMSSISDNLINGTAIVRYDIQNAPVKEFRFKIPAEYTNIEFSCPNLRRRDQNKTNGEWSVEVQNAVFGQFQLQITWEKPVDLKTNTLDLPPVQAIGIERESGFVVVTGKKGLQVDEKTSSGELMKIDTSELPDWISGVQGQALAWRYIRPGYSLSVLAQRFADAAVLQALAEQVRLTSVVADDGQSMTELRLVVRNNGLQNLEVELPGGSSVWSAFVGGEAVRPAKSSQGKLLLPLEASGAAADAPVTVELTYIAPEKFPAGSGSVDLISPRLNVPLNNARWDVYLPPDYDYKKFKGSMIREEQTAPTVQTYSLAEYHAQEEGKKQAQKAEASAFISNARMQLSAGNVKAVNNFENGSYNDKNSALDIRTRQELADVQQSVDELQAKNLNQQNRVYINSGQQSQAYAPAKDAEMNGIKQWNKVAQMQQLAVARVQPLRVNLPTRGVHYAFTQILQTEPDKALNIQFTAANTRSGGLFGKLVVGALCFIVLWVVVKLALSRSPSEAQAA